MAFSPAEVAYMEAHRDQTLQPDLISSTAICMTAAYAAVVLRFVSRSIGKVSFGYDDVFIIIALVKAFDHHGKVCLD